MAYSDLQEYLLRLEASRELYRYEKPITSADAAVKLATKHKKALLFERIDGVPWPVVINTLGSERRTAWALGVDNLQSLGERARRLFDIPMPLKFGDLMGRAGDVMGLLRTPTMAMNGKTPPCQEVVWPSFDLTQAPHVSIENKPIICDVVLIVECHDRLFVKTVDAEIVDSHHLRLKQIDGLKLDEPCAAALVFGDDPSLVWAASLKLPRYVTPFMVAGWLRGRPLALTNGVTLPLHVPAHAEIVFEGVISGQDEHLTFTLSTVTQRTNALFPLGWRSAWADEAAERLLLPAVRLVVDGLHDLHFGAQYVIASLKGDSVTPQHAVMMLWAFDMTAFARLVVIVDESVDVRDLVAVRAAVKARCHPQQDLMHIGAGQARLKLGAIALNDAAMVDASITLQLEDVMRLLSDGAPMHVLNTDPLRG